MQNTGGLYTRKTILVVTFNPMNLSEDYEFSVSSVKSLSLDVLLVFSQLVCSAS